MRRVLPVRCCGCRCQRMPTDTTRSDVTAFLETTLSRRRSDESWIDLDMVHHGQPQHHHPPTLPQAEFQPACPPHGNVWQ
jgi:hypothetical protein